MVMVVSAPVLLILMVLVVLHLVDVARVPIGIMVVVHVEEINQLQYILILLPDRIILVLHLPVDADQDGLTTDHVRVSRPHLKVVITYQRQVVAAGFIGMLAHVLAVQIPHLHLHQPLEVVQLLPPGLARPDITG